MACGADAQRGTGPTDQTRRALRNVNAATAASRPRTIKRPPPEATGATVGREQIPLTQRNPLWHCAVSVHAPPSDTSLGVGVEVLVDVGVDVGVAVGVTVGGMGVRPGNLAISMNLQIEAADLS